MCQIWELPLEMLLNIVRFLEVGDVVALSATCRQFHSVCRDDSIWERLANNDHVARENFSKFYKESR